MGCSLTLMTLLAYDCLPRKNDTMFRFVSAKHLESFIYTDNEIFRHGYVCLLASLDRCCNALICPGSERFAGFSAFSSSIFRG